jgi:hypothetical protein
MIEQILPNNNERCYSNFSPTFREVNTPKGPFIVCTGVAENEVYGDIISLLYVASSCRLGRPVVGSPWLLLHKHDLNHTAQHFQEKGKKYHTGDVLAYIVTGIDLNRMVTGWPSSSLFRGRGRRCSALMSQDSWLMSGSFRSGSSGQQGGHCCMSFSIFFQRLSTRLWQSEETYSSDKLVCPLAYMHDWSLLAVPLVPW